MCTRFGPFFSFSSRLRHQLGASVSKETRVHVRARYRPARRFSPSVVPSGLLDCRINRRVERMDTRGRVARLRLMCRWVSVLFITPFLLSFLGVGSRCSLISRLFPFSPLSLSFFFFYRKSRRDDHVVRDEVARHEKSLLQPRRRDLALQRGVVETKRRGRIFGESQLCRIREHGRMFDVRKRITTMEHFLQSREGREFTDFFQIPFLNVFAGTWLLLTWYHVFINEIIL